MTNLRRSGGCHSCFWFQFIFSSNLAVACFSLSASEFGFHFTQWPKGRVVAPGQQIKLECKTNLSPEKVLWVHNHHLIHPEDIAKIYSFNQTTAGPSVVQKRSRKGSQLILKISTTPFEYKQQQGLYQCVSSIWALAVTSLPGQIQIGYMESFSTSSSSKNSLRVKVGSSFKIPCLRPKSLPEAQLCFFKDGILLQTNNTKKFFVTEVGDLVVLKAKGSSKGIYWCSARNEVLNITQSNLSRTSVTVRRKRKEKSSIGIPILTVFDSIVKIKRGEKQVLMCLVISNVADKVYWSFNDIPLQKKDQSENGVSLVIDDITSHDAGVYRCRGSNSFGSSFVDVHLVVEVSSYLLEKSEGHEIEEGSNLTLMCRFGGFPAPTIAWIFVGNVLNNKDNILVDGNNLQINSIRLKQAGVYQCFGFNPYGTAQGSSIVTILPKTIRPNSSEIDDSSLKENEQIKKEEEKLQRKKLKEKKENSQIAKIDCISSPSRPKLTKISDESIMVMWELDRNSSLSIQFFKVQYKIILRIKTDSMLNSQKWKTLNEDIASHVRSFEVTGLENGFVYRFRVAAIYVNNDSGVGPSSHKFLLEKTKVLQPPEKAPRILKIYQYKNNTVVMEWSNDAISYTEGFIVYYRESTTVADYTKITVLGEDKCSYFISHLRPKQIYDFKLCSFNMAGRSNFSQIYTYIPAGINLERKYEETPQVTVPIVMSETEMISSDVLYVSMGIGIASLFSIVIISFTYYSCEHKNNLGEEILDTKFMDTSLRIHRQIQLNDDHFDEANSIALLKPQRTNE